jgi:hypothetical protein
VAQLVETLLYKAEDCGFDSQWCLLKFLIDLALESTQTLTEMGGKGGRCVGLTNLPHLCADCLEIRERQPPEHSGPVQVCNGIVYFFLQMVLGKDIYMEIEGK